MLELLNITEYYGCKSVVQWYCACLVFDINITIDNNVLSTLTNIFFPLGKMIGMVWSQTSFILSSQSWEIGSPPTGGAGRIKLSCVVPTSVIHI